MADRFDAVIIGGGPSGLFCAIHCTAPGRRILLLEKKPACGNKLLITGSGQCNLTHEGDIREFLSHYGPNGKFLQPALFGYPNLDLIRFFSGRGIPVECDRSGKLFPRSRRSKDILACLIHESEQAGVIIRCNDPVSMITRGTSGFSVYTRCAGYQAECLVIATGGMSYPETGSSGDGYEFARSLGHSIRDPAPALTPVIIEDFPFADLAGLSFADMHFSIWRNGKKISRCNGDVVFTHAGLSGPGILDNSRSMAADDEIRLSFVRPECREDLPCHIADRIRESRGRRIASVLASYRLPLRLTRALCSSAGVDRDTPCSRLSAAERTRIITALSGFPLRIRSLGSFSVAMATRGGVPITEINRKTMESNLVPNLYFAGEVMDVDGDTGGYNLQAAFSTGHLAGQSIRSKWMKTGIW